MLMKVLSTIGSRSARGAGVAALAISVLLGASGVAHATECTTALVTHVFRYTGVCGGNAIYSTNLSNNLWICTANEGQAGLVLAAFLSGRSIGYEIGVSGSGGAQCAPPSNYAKTATYLVIN